MKELYKYAANAEQLAQEVIEDVTGNEIANLRKQLSELGFQQWMVWRATHSQDIHQYMASTPSERKQKKKWQTQKAMLALAAYWGYQLATHVLKVISQDPAFLIGDGYRDKAADVAALFPELAEPSIVWWPWQDDPFEV